MEINDREWEKIDISNLISLASNVEEVILTEITDLKGTIANLKNILDLDKVASHKNNSYYKNH